MVANRYALFGLLFVFSVLVAGCGDNAPVAPRDTSSEFDALLEESTRDVAATIARLEKMSAEFLSLEPSAAPPNVEFVPAGSVDALEAAIATVGPNGIVVVQPGMHTESGTVTIPHRVILIGLPGATVQVDTQPLPPAAQADPALYVFGAPNTIIFGLEIVPAGPIGGTGILAENSAHTMILRNTLREHQFGVLLEQADHSVVWGNTIVSSLAWTTGEIEESHGVVVINAENSWVIGNDLSNGLFGVWACDLDGRLFHNNAHGNFVGIILCKVPDNALPLPSGVLAGSEFPCGNWMVRHNDASNNFDAGHMVIDGANNNFLANNTGENNGTYDIELVGDSERFGFPTPTSFENTVIVGNPSLVVKDCGIDNTVIGGTQVDTDLDPCF